MFLMGHPKLWLPVSYQRGPTGLTLNLSNGVKLTPFDLHIHLFNYSISIYPIFTIQTQLNPQFFNHFTAIFTVRPPFTPIFPFNLHFEDEWLKLCKFFKTNFQSLSSHLYHLTSQYTILTIQGPYTPVSYNCYHLTCTHTSFLPFNLHIHNFYH